MTGRRALLALTCLGALLIAALLGAGSASAAEPCLNEAIREEQHSTYLPDCRAYEMVTPPYKENSLAQINAISEDGMRLLGVSNGVYSDPEDTGSAFSDNQYITAREPSGWASMSMSRPYSEFASFEVEEVSTDLRSMLWNATTDPQQRIEEIYLGPTPRGPLSRVGPLSPSTPAGELEATLGFIGGSHDLSHSLFRAFSPNPQEANALWPGDETEVGRRPSLYEYVGTESSEPSLVGISDEGRVAHIGESHLISKCGTSIGGAATFGNSYNAISADGARIYFTAFACNGSTPVNELYARIDNTEADAHTVAISEPSASDCSECELLGPADAEFQGASEDGSRAYFTTSQKLLSGATGNGPYIYEFDFNGPDGERLRLASGGDTEGSRVQKVVRVSPDGSHVYFLAQGVLATNKGAAIEPETGLPQLAAEGASNLYVYERDAAFPTGRIAFIARTGVGQAQATPDGRFLAFESAADLTPDQHQLPEAGQVFEYDAQAQSLLRVSRGQNLYSEDGNSPLYSATLPERRYAAWPGRALSGIALSADGAYVYFTSEDGLTQQALSGARNVYEYHSGEVSLISSGGHDAASSERTRYFNLIGTDVSGHDVFLSSPERLAPQDIDTQVNIYDARIGGGFAPPLPLPFCEGDKCQGNQSLVPFTPKSGSPDFSGPGNQVPIHKKHHHKRRGRNHRRLANDIRGGAK